MNYKSNNKLQVEEKKQKINEKKYKKINIQK